MLVNNAGVYAAQPVTEGTYEEWQAAWQHTLAVNLTGAANATLVRGPAHDRGGRRPDHQRLLPRRLPR